MDVVRTDEGETLYRKCGPRHHHHLVCRSCGLSVELDGPAVERWAAKAAKDNGFLDVKHVVELFGPCKSCSALPGGSVQTHGQPKVTSVQLGPSSIACDRQDPRPWTLRAAWGRGRARFPGISGRSGRRSW